MSRGFAVFAFEGGNGRRLRISAPDALVEVVGTRFFVESDGTTTRVGVAEGKVRVLSLLGSRLLTAGESMEIGGPGDGSPAHAQPYLDDPFLLRELADADAAGPTSAQRRRRRVVKPAVAAPSAGADTAALFAGLERAEDLARLGAFREAIEVYTGIANDERPSHQAYADLARYEIARLWGFRLGEIRRARSILRPLSRRGTGEVARQATLALCELDLAARPCQAAVCLRELEQGGDFQLSSEVKLLLEHWGLSDLTCPEASR
jgi:hypothetical protein